MKCDLCGSTGVTATVSDLVCTSCGYCVERRYDDQRYSEATARSALTTVDVTSISICPLDPRGTVIGHANHRWQRRHGWLRNHTASDQGQCRMRRRIGELCRALNLGPELEAAGYRLSVALVARHPHDADPFMLAAVAGVFGTIRSRALPITLRELLRAARATGRTKLRWSTLSRYLSGDAYLRGLLGSRDPHTYVPRFFDQAWHVIEARNGHGWNLAVLRPRLIARVEAVLARAAPRTGAHPQIVAAAAIYVACHEVLAPCPVRQTSFEPAVPEFSLRECVGKDFPPISRSSR